MLLLNIMSQADEVTQVDVSRPWLKNYAHGKPWDVALEPMPMFELFRRSAEKYADCIYLDFLGREFRYKAIAADVDRAARGLQTLGVRKGVKVGLFLPNCPQYIIAYYAILKAGGTVVNFSPLYAVPELVHQVEDSETDIMICLDVANLYTVIAEVLDKSRLRCLIVAELASVLPRGKALLYRLFKGKEQAHVKPDISHLRWQDVLDERRDFHPVVIDPLNDIAVLQYTGGTTGSPKGAMLTHANLSINAQQVAASDPDYGQGTERMLGALPFFHVFANTVVLNASTLQGAQIVMLPKFELKAVLKTIERKRITVMPGVPTMYTAILDHPKIGDFDLSSIRICISGGAPMPVELKKKFEAKAGAIVCEGYGLTESSGVAAVNPVRGVNKPGSIGLPMPGTDIIVTDREHPERILAQGEVGEICLRGPQVMAGYWKRPDATASVMQGNMLHTGDVGYIDSDGYTFIIDRMKDMITVGGFKVFPRHLEDILYTHPAIKEATVIGVPDAYLGERPKAFVVLQDDSKGTIDGAALLAWLKPQVGKHELPVAVELRDALPKTMIGKISKKDLQAEEAAKQHF
jgi:long-chain acyl-CoA synthetase